MLDLTAITALADRDTDAAAEALRAYLASDEAVADEAARLAERLGQWTMAVRAWQRAVTEDPSSVEAWQALHTLYDERGEAERARACIDRLADLGVAKHPVVTAPTAPAPQSDWADGDLVRFVDLFGGREGVHARMWHDPGKGGRDQRTGYSPIREPLTPEVARAHLEGSITVGTCMVRTDQSVRAFALDLDLTQAALDQGRGDAAFRRELTTLVHNEGLRLLAALRQQGLNPLLVDSGRKGRHLWCFLDRPHTAREVREVAADLLRRIRPTDVRLRVELFPKQDSVPEGGLGNLIKLPCGLHRRSGRYAQLLDDEGQPRPAPAHHLRTVRRTGLPSPAAWQDLPLVEAPTAPEDHTPRPAPPVRLPWTEGRLFSEPRLGHLLRACPMLHAVARGVLDGDSVPPGAVHVLNHTLGHLPEGVGACHYLLDQIPDVPDAARPGRPRRGHPMGCAKVRGRLPELVARVACDCRFPDRPGAHRHPLRHLDELEVPSDAEPSLDDLLAAWTRQLVAVHRLEREVTELRGALVEALDQVPDRRWQVQEGTWRLTESDDLPVLAFEPT